MEQVRILAPQETVLLDRDRLGALYEELGEVGAEDVICRAMEELALRLGQAEKLFREGAQEEMLRRVRSLVAIGEQVGMDRLARVAGDVCRCAERGDPVALAATLSRLVRLGDRSLRAVWEADQFCP